MNIGEEYAYRRGFDDAVDEVLEILDDMPFYMTKKEFIAEIRRVLINNE